MKKAIPILIFIVATFTACSDHSGKQSDNETRLEHGTFYLCDKLVTIDTITKSEFDKLASSPIPGIPKINDTDASLWNTSEARNIYRDVHLVIRHKDTLIFAIDNGSIATLVNKNDSDDSYGVYYYEGYDQRISQYIVYGSFYESHCYQLVDKRTGHITVTIGPPVVSPDGSYFICGNTDLYAGFTTNGFELYENTSPPKLVCEQHIANWWGPQEIKWLSDKVLYVEADVLDSATSLNHVAYYKLTLR